MADKYLISGEELEKMYRENENGFKDYVDEWCRCRRKPKEEVLRCLIANYKAQDCKGILRYEQ